MSFLGELKRRNVLRVAGVYAVVGWLLVQVAAAIEEAMFLPVWFDTVVVSFLAIGFPVALIFAWAFELTPEGIRRTADVSVDESITAQTGSKLDLVLVFALLVFAAAMLVPRFLPQQMTPSADSDAIPEAEAPASGVAVADNEVAAGAPDRASIAVLPFADLSPDGDQGYFADGISEELLNVLAQVKALKVAGRTSSFAFKGRNEDLREIGQVLNVAHILEGSVRSQGDRVRVTAQLIQVSDGFHLWSQTYDGNLSDIFAVQDDIAQQILTALQEQLLVAEEPSVAPATRTDVTAYGLFLEGRDLIASRDVTKMTRALALLDQALAIDDAYAPAYAARAQAYIMLSDRPSSYGDMPAHVATPKAQADVDRALALDPQLAHAHAVQGLLSGDRGQPDLAVASLRRALELNPNSLDARNWLALALVDLGRFRAALEQIRALIAIDPLYSPAVNNAMIYAVEVGDLDGAREIARAFIRRSRDPIVTTWYTGRIAWLEGRLADMITLFEGVPAIDLGNRISAWLAFGYSALGEFGRVIELPALTTSYRLGIQAEIDPASALASLREELALDPERVNTHLVLIESLSIAGEDRAIVDFYTQTYGGDLETFATRLRSASAFAQLPPYRELALALQAMGDTGELERCLLRWREDIEAYRAGGAQSANLDIEEGRYHAIRGDARAGIEQLQRAYDKQGYLPVSVIRERSFDTLRSNPDFEALRDRARARINEERAKLDWPALPAEAFVNPLRAGAGP